MTIFGGVFQSPGVDPFATDHGYYDDIQGILGTALTGSSTWTIKTVRNTGITSPHIAKSDIFTMAFQYSHRKKLQTPVEIHMHYAPMSASNGNIKISYEYGWFNIGDACPDVLPNSGSVEWALTSADRYQFKIKKLIADIPPPAGEAYSSILISKFTRVTPASTDWGSGDLCLWHVDSHFQTDRLGSYNEITD
jgi:hypothetical protein